MRRLAWGIGGGVALMLVAVAALALLLPGIVRGPAVRDRIQTAARDALGRDVRYGELTVGFFPPSLLVAEPQVAGEREGDPPFVEARSLSLRVALLPLLVRAVVVDSVVLEGATLRLTRTAQGLALPRPTPAEVPGEPAPGAGEEAPPGAMRLAVRSVALRDATVVLADRVVKPAVTWTVEDLALEARGESLDAPLRFETSFALASGGRVKASGFAQPGGDLDVDVSLDAVAIAPLSPYVRPGLRPAGTLSGSVAVRGPSARPSAFEVDVVLADAEVRLDDVELRGRLAVEATLAGGLDALAGPFEVDATGAELVLAGGFRKPRGTPASLTGTLARASDGAATVDYRLRLHNAQARGEARVGKRTRVSVDASGFDLEGWDALVPALAEYAPSGRVRLDGLVVETAPLAVRGTVFLDGVTAAVAQGVRTGLRGALVGEGDVIRTRDLTLESAEQTLALEGELRGLSGTPRYRLRAETGSEGADLDRLVAVLADKPDFASGPLRFQGDFTGALADGSPLDTLAGRVRFEAGPGRLRGVSLLRLVFDRLGALGPVAALGGAVFGGAPLTQFYDDTYQSLSATLDVDGGVARTEDFRLVHRAYVGELAGKLGLADLALDMSGRLVLGDTLVGLLPGPWEGALGGAIPLAHLGGTLDDPRVSLPSGIAGVLARGFGAGARLGGAIGDRIGIGKETGRAVGDLLEGVLGGGRRSPPASPPGPAPPPE